MSLVSHISSLFQENRKNKRIMQQKIYKNSGQFIFTEGLVLKSNWLGERNFLIE